jgi:hypothetical protein
MTEVYNLLAQKGGRVEYVWHVAGMPYAVCSSAALTTLLASGQTARRRAMFGDSSYNAGVGDTYPADTMPIIPALASADITQKIRMDDTAAKLTGGEWSIKLQQGNPGINWNTCLTDLRLGDVWGLPCVHSIDDPRIGQLATARLYSNFVFGNTNLDFCNDTGGRLAAKINAATYATYLWIGQECVIANAVADSGTYFTAMIECRNVFRTRQQSFYIDNQSSSIFVSEKPLGGIGNRPCYLWALAIDNDGALTGDPALIIHGKVGTSITSSGGVTTVQCLPWHQWLDTTVRTKAVRGSMSGYTLSRTTATADHNDDQCAHILFDESNLHEHNRIAKVWLCAEGTSVHFDTLADFRKAIEEELGKADTYGGKANTSTFGSDDLLGNYKFKDDGSLRPSTEWPLGAPYRVWVTGPVAWALGLGYPLLWRVDVLKGWFQNRRQFFNSYYVVGKDRIGWLQMTGYWLILLDNGGVQYEYWTGAAWTFDINDAKQYFIAPDQTAEPFITYPTAVIHYYGSDAGDGTGHLWLCCHDEDEDPADLDLDKDGTVSPYLLQWHYDADGETSYGTAPLAWCNKFPINEDDIHLNEEMPAERFDEDRTFIIGEGKGLLHGKPPLIMAYLDDTSVVHLTCGDDGSETFYFKGLFDSSIISGTVYGSDQLYHKGMCLMHVSKWDGREDDPWIVSQPLYHTAQDPVVLLKSLLGDDDNTANVADWYQMRQIPDAVDDGVSDHEASVDWDKLSLLCSGKIVDGLRYILALNDNEKITLSELLSGLCQFFGLAPTWEWRGDIKQHWMSFRLAGVDNQTTALLEGRTVNTTSRVAGKLPTEKASGAWEYSSIEIKTNYDTNEKEYKGQLNVKDEAGYAELAGANKVLAINGRLLWIEGLENITSNDLLQKQIRAHTSMLLGNIIMPRPEISVDCGVSKALECGVGTDLLLTDPTCHNPFTGALGLTSQTAVVVERSLALGDKTGCNLALRISSRLVKGWAPALRVAANNSTKEENYIAALANSHDFGGDATQRTDLSFFDCLNWNKSTGAYAARGCACGNYRVIAFRENDLAPTLMHFEIYDIDVVTNTFKITGISYEAWDVTYPHIIIFDTWDHADLQACQRYFICFAESDGTLTDDAANVTDGDRWL